MPLSEDYPITMMSVKSSSHLAERIRHWLRLTAVWPASCLTMLGKQRDGQQILVHPPVNTARSQAPKQQRERVQLQRERSPIGPQLNCITQDGRRAYIKCLTQ